MGLLNRLFGGSKKQEKKLKAPTRSKPDFPLGDSIISDPDIKTFADLGRYYPLPAGFEYQKTAEGAPVVALAGHDKRYSFLIEAEMLTFDQPYTRKDGRTGYKTTEVFKRSR